MKPSIYTAIVVSGYLLSFPSSRLNIFAGQVLEASTNNAMKYDESLQAVYLGPSRVPSRKASE